MISTIDTYIDGLILRDGSSLMWQFDGGYVALNASAAPTSWNYYISDHLGSTRMVVTSTNTIKETINYYPYGSEMRMTDPAQIANTSNKERFRFSGKELDFQNGLNMYDFGARMFDVAGVPAWTRIDPLAEDNRHVTPYSYCNGDPVNRVDPDGRDDYFNSNGVFLFSKGTGGAIFIKKGERFLNFKTFDLRYNKNTKMAARIVGYYANDVGIKYDRNGGSGQIGIHTMHRYDGQRALAATENGNIYINMTYGHLDEYMYDSFQLRSTLVHESQHKQDQDKKKEYASAQRHAEIILTEMQSEYFSSCSNEYKEDQVKQLKRYLEDAAKDPNTDRDFLFYLNTLFRSIKDSQ